jgi:hypothetical protein
MKRLVPLNSDVPAFGALAATAARTVTTDVRVTPEVTPTAVIVAMPGFARVTRSEKAPAVSAVVCIVASRRGDPTGYRLYEAALMCAPLDPSAFGAAPYFTEMSIVSPAEKPVPEMRTPLPTLAMADDRVNVGLSAAYPEGDGVGVAAEATAGVKLSMANATIVAPAQRRRVMCGLQRACLVMHIFDI